MAWWQQSPSTFNRGPVPMDAGVAYPGLPAWQGAQAPEAGVGWPRLPDRSRFPLSNVPVPGSDVDWSFLSGAFTGEDSEAGLPGPFGMPRPSPDRGNIRTHAPQRGLGAEVIDWLSLSADEYNKLYGPEVPQTVAGQPVPPRLPQLSSRPQFGAIPPVDLGIVPTFGAPPMQPQPALPPTLPYGPDRPAPTRVDYSDYRRMMEEARPDLPLPEAPQAPDESALREAMLYNVLAGLGAGVGGAGPDARIGDILLAAAGGGAQGMARGKREQRELQDRYDVKKERFVGYQRENARSESEWKRFLAGAGLDVAKGEAAQTDAAAAADFANRAGRYQTDVSNLDRRFAAQQQGQQVGFQNALRQYQFETQQQAARAPKIISTAGGMLYTQVTEPDEQGNLRSRVVVSTDPIKQLMTMRALTGSAKEAFKLSGVMQQTNPMFKHYALAGVLDEGGPPVLAAVFGAETLTEIDKRAQDAAMAAAGSVDEKERTAIYLRTRYALMSQLLSDPEIQSRALQFLGGEE